MSGAYDDLIERARRLLHPRVAGGTSSGTVASALVADNGGHYGGVCIDTRCGLGFCAEHTAVAAMVTAGRYRIARIVAVRRSEAGLLHVLPPCGRCREFLRQIDDANLDTEVVLGRHDAVPLRRLLPFHEPPAPLE